MRRTKNQNLFNQKVFRNYNCICNCNVAFPYYSGIFYPDTAKHIIVVDKSDIKTTEFKISGMTCAGCEEHVNHEVNKLSGIVSSKASYESGNAIIEFDKTKTQETKSRKQLNNRL